MEKRFRFTKQKLEDLPLPPPRKFTYYYDSDVKGLAVRVSSTGAKTFCIYRRIDGKPERVTIGQSADLSLEQARKKAKEINSAIVLGDNPQGRKRRAKEELTLGELFDLYIADYATDRCRTWKDMAANFERYYGDWRLRKLSTIKRQEVQVRVNQLGRDRGHSVANRSLDDLRAAFNWGTKYGYHNLDNPWEKIDKFEKVSRERFIRPDEFKAFFKALKAQRNIDLRDYVYLSLYTGARQANVLAMRWEEIDFDLAIWRIPRTKNDQSHTVPLTQAAVDTLRDRRDNRKNDADEWVFPSDGVTGHLVEVKKGWQSLLKSAKLTDLRMHDLRRTLGSYMAMTNQSLQMIGRVLGHRSHTSTQIYARLANDPVREAMERAQDEMFVAAGIATGSPNVVSLSDRKKPQRKARNSRRTRNSKGKP